MHDVILFIGPANSGKGTQVEYTNKHHPGLLHHISTGDLIRARLKANDPTVEFYRSRMGQGELFPDEGIVTILNEEIGQLQKTGTYGRAIALDGFPRTPAQVPHTLRNFNILDAYLFNVWKETVFARGKGRYERAIASGTEPRNEDLPQPMEKRWADWERFTLPAVAALRAAGVEIYEIDANGSVEEVGQQLLARIEAKNSYIRSLTSVEKRS